MRSLSSPRTLLQRRLIGAGAVVFSLCLAAAMRTEPVAAKAAAMSTPLYVANALDRIVQPRFQRDAGQFGEDRIVSELDGHTRIDEIDAETKSERRGFRELRAAGRSYVVAILHVAHKPGSHKDTHDHGKMDSGAPPTAQALVSVNSTLPRAMKSYDWANTHLTQALSPYASAVKRGRSVSLDYGGWVVALRPIRAEHDSCIGCHAGAHRGDTLGAMIYAVNQSKSDRPMSAIWSGGD